MPRKPPVVEDDEDLEEVEEDEDFDVDDVLDELDELSDDEDEEDAPTVSRSARKAKSAKTATKRKAKADADSSFGTRELADLAGVEPRTLRLLLRAEFPKPEGQGHYEWSGPNDPEVKAILARIQKNAAKKIKDEQIADLKARKAAAKPAAKPAAKAPAKKATAKATTTRRRSA